MWWCKARIEFVKGVTWDQGEEQNKEVMMVDARRRFNRRTGQMS